MNEIYNEKRGPMSQFWTVDMARGKYLVTWSSHFDPLWGFTRVLRKLPR